MMLTSERPWQSVRDLTLNMDMSWSPLCLRSALALNGLAGYVITIIETARQLKCRLALDSIAPRYVCLAVPEHVLDVGRKRRIRIDVVADLGGGQAEAHRKAEEVNQLLAGVPDEMRAENAVGGLVDN